MKFFSLFLLALFVSSFLFAQKQSSIIFKVADAAGKKVTYNHHIAGVYWPSFPKEDTLNANGELVLTSKETVAGVYTFNYKNTGVKLFLEPGRNYTITVDPANKETPFTVEAPDKEAQLAYSKLGWDFCQTVAFRLYRQDTSFANVKQKMVTAIDSCLQPFNQLKAQHKMSKAFYAHTQSLIKNYYASVLSAYLIPRVSKTVYRKDSTGYNAAKVEQLIADWHEVEKTADLMDPVAMSTTTYQDYFYFYNTFYLNNVLYLKDRNEKVKGVVNSHLPYHSVQRYFTKEPLREYWMAVSLDNYIIENRFEQFVPMLYTEFVKQYPNSKYIKYLTDGIEKIKQFHAASKKEFTASHQFVQQADSISTVDELLTRFKGKTIYIDMWATWCGPCKEQFAFKDELDPFLKSKGVEVLYISLDKPRENEQWKSMIKYYNLEGHHIRASEKLVTDIYKVFSNGQGISIPRYVICKDGKVVVAKAKAPGDKGELHKQIESVL